MTALATHPNWRRQKHRRQVTRSAAQTIKSAREARVALLRVVEFVGLRSRMEVVDHDGAQLADRVRLSGEERVENLKYAMTWLQNAEQTMRLLRVELERLMEHELRGVEGWR